jgi:hypothetical protein
VTRFSATTGLRCKRLNKRSRTRQAKKWKAWEVSSSKVIWPRLRAFLPGYPVFRDLADELSRSQSPPSRDLRLSHSCVTERRVESVGNPSPQKSNPMNGRRLLSVLIGCSIIRTPAGPSAIPDTRPIGPWHNIRSRPTPRPARSASFRAPAYRPFEYRGQSNASPLRTSQNATSSPSIEQTATVRPY